MNKDFGKTVGKNYLSNYHQAKANFKFKNPEKVKQNLTAITTAAGLEEDELKDCEEMAKENKWA